MTSSHLLSFRLKSHLLTMDSRPCVSGGVEGTHPKPSPTNLIFNHLLPTPALVHFKCAVSYRPSALEQTSGHESLSRPQTMTCIFLAWILSPNPNIKLHASRNTKQCNKVWGGSTNDVQHYITSNDEKLQGTSSYQQRNDWIMLTSAQATKRPLKRITW